MNKKEAYSVLTDLIFKGFLTAELNIDGKLFVFKTVNEREFDFIKMMAGRPDREDYNIRFNVYFLVYSLFLAENQNVLHKRNERIDELFQLFINIPEVLFKKIITNLNEMRNDSYEALKYLEGFTYTRLSRSNWRMLNGHIPSQTEFTGIQGTTEIGLNVHQEQWMIINRSLDMEEKYNSDFSLALMIASASNAKGARNIRGQHDTALKNSEDRKRRLAEEGFLDVKEWKPDGWAAPVDTVEGLVAELERNMTGVKDKHDLFIEGFMKKTRDEAEKKTREAEERIKTAQEKYGDVLIDGGTRILTEEETKKLMSKKKRHTVQVESEETTSAQDKQRFFKKIGARVLTGKG